MDSSCPLDIFHMSLVKPTCHLWAWIHWSAKGPLWDLNETLISEESLNGSYNYPPLSYLLIIIFLLFLCLDLFEWTWRKGSSKSDFCLYTNWVGAPYDPPHGHCWNHFFPYYLWLGADKYYTIYIRYREKGVERASNGTGPTTREPAFSVLWLIVPLLRAGSRCCIFCASCTSCQNLGALNAKAVVEVSRVDQTGRKIPCQLI